MLKEFAEIIHSSLREFENIVDVNIREDNSMYVCEINIDLEMLAYKRIDLEWNKGHIKEPIHIGIAIQKEASAWKDSNYVKHEFETRLKHELFTRLKQLNDVTFHTTN